MKDNEYFNRFLQYIVANLVAAICYFLFAALISLGGTLPGEAASRTLSALVTALPFALFVFVSTLRDKSLPRRDIRAYLAGIGRGDIITYAVWSICGAMIALAGEAAGITVYIFLAQAIPTASLVAALGQGIGLITAVLVNVALYTGARLLGITLRK